MMAAIRIISAVLLLALAVLFSAALYVFYAAFLRKHTPQNPDYDPFENHIKQPYLGRFRSGKQWLLNPKRELEYINIQSRDRLKLQGYLLPAGDLKRFVVLVHGYHSGSLHDFGCAAKYYHRLGYSVLLTDMRAHGGSEGRVISFGLRERHDLKLWIDELTRRYGDDTSIFLHGLSMGATTSLMTTGLKLPGSVKGVIADCGFTSPHDIVCYLMKRNYGLSFPPQVWALSVVLWFAIGQGLKGYSTLTAMRGCPVPVLFIHGAADDYVPTRMSKENYDACTSEKQLFIVPGAAHAISYLVDPRGYVERVVAFLEKYN